MVKFENEKIKVIISPDMGMSLMSFKIHDREILNQDLKDDFLKMRKGLGPIIVPHFNQASPTSFEDINPNDDNYKLFPHIKYLRELGIMHPFQHGIGRYVKWNFQTDNNVITGQISGDDKINGIPLKKFTKFNFNAKISYELFPDYLIIKIQVSGEKPVASGIHFYYDTVDKDSIVTLKANKGLEKIDNIILNTDHNDILKPLADKNGFSTSILKTKNYILTTKFRADGNPENVFDSLIIFSNTERRFVCIEPVSYNIETKNTKTNHIGEIQLIPN